MIETAVSADAAIAEHVVRDAQEQRRIDAAREADQRRAVAGDDLAQPLVLVGERRRHRRCGAADGIEAICEPRRISDRDPFAAGDRGGDLGRDVQLGLDASRRPATRARVAGWAGTNSEQQSSKGRIDVS